MAAGGASHREIESAQRSQARRLRASMTDAEARLWQRLRGKRFAALVFRRQVPIGPFIADFCCHAARLVVEVDGGQHGTHTGLVRDGRRDAFLASEGYRVLRFWNHDVLAQIDAVLDGIWTIAVERSPDRASPETPLPVPPPQGGRGRRLHAPAPIDPDAPAVRWLDDCETSLPVPSPLVGEGQGEGYAAHPLATASPHPATDTARTTPSSASKTGRHP